ncbi:MAG: RNase adapter RapZ [Alphaproteobacteria bacterium]|nr:RNase adapter RapZ [Alphaproteobacteria bacterium]
MKLVLVTGMSGAGKSVALKTLEDSGFEAIDNIPLAFLPAVAASGARLRNLAVGVDIRSRDFSAHYFEQAIAPLRKNPDLTFSVLFLDCDDEVLRRRFTETRRRHPLALDRTVLDGIRQERELIDGLHEISDIVIDTSDTDAASLRTIINTHFATGEKQLLVQVASFSFRRGVPRDADIVFDVRFLKNPHYDPELKALTGLDALVGAHIETDPDFAGFFDKLTGLIQPLLPRYLAEGKHYLTIAIGCTGGQHRSVYTAQKLGGVLKAAGYNVTIKHKNLEKE